MPEYLAPGVYVEEIDSGSKPIEGVGVSTAAFIGYAKSGEFNKPIFITSWGDFCRSFGEDDAKVLRPLSDELGETPVALLQEKRETKKSLLQYAEDRLRQRAEARDERSIPKGDHKDDILEFADAHKITLAPEPYIEGCYLAYAVKGFFDNGGGRCYIVRVPRPAAPRRKGEDKPRYEADLALFEHVPASLKDAGKGLPAVAALDGIRLKARESGEAGNGVAVEVVHGPEDGQFRLRFLQDGKSIEELPPNKREFLTPATAMGAKSNFAEVIEVAVAERPQATTFLFAGGEDKLDVTPAELMPLAKEIAKIKDKEADFVGDVDARRGAKGLAVLDDVNFIAAPDLMSGVFERVESKGGALGPERCVMTKEGRDYILRLQKELTDHCERLNDRMAILDPIPDLNPQEVAQARVDGKFSCDHGQAALYYPWIKVPDMLNRREKATLLVPPCGHIAGVWARTAVERGIHKAPANEALMGVVGLAHDVTKGEQEKLNPMGVNCIRTFPSSGIRVWGARTLAPEASSWKYVNVRNLFNYLERSIERGMQWVVFEPNDHDLWGRVRRNVSAFLWTTWKEGMLFGRTPGEAFYVKCDEETNPEEMRDLGRLYVEIGVNPVKPAEFVIIRMGQWSGGSERSERAN